MTASKTPKKSATRAVRKKTATKPAARKTAAKKVPARVAPAARAPAAKKSAARKAAPKKTAKPTLVDVVTAALEDMKAQNVTVLDVRGVTDVADTIVIASGTSDRHVKSIAGRVADRAREAGQRALGVEGERDGEWVLVDLQDVIVHVMLPRVREFYALEKLWDVRSSERGAG
jgi:ribosome-associated protein